MSQSTAELEAAPGDTPTGLESAPTPATSYTSFVLEYGPEPTGMTWAGRDVPLTTPYVWPTPHCPQVSRIVFPNQVGVDNYGTTQVPQIIVDDSWAYDQSGYDVENCFPNDEYDGGSEWNSRYGKYGGRDQYGRYYGGKGEQRWGAVCPQNWTAYDMGMFSSASISGETNNWETWSTAICCPE